MKNFDYIKVINITVWKRDGGIQILNIAIGFLAWVAVLKAVKWIFINV